jgi:hypothetical protein
LARATSMKLLVFGLLLIRAHSVVNPDPDQIPRADQIPNTPGATPDNAAGPVAPPADPVARGNWSAMWSAGSSGYSVVQAGSSLSTLGRSGV